MKIIDGIKLKGKKVEIPDCSRDDLPEFFKEMGYSVGVEIGVYKGEFTEKFCRAGLRIYAVDPWITYEDYGVKNSQFPIDQKNFYEQTKERLAPYKNCTILKKTSMEAVKDFEDESLDFVYIDGNHEFKYITEDIWEWTKKIKKGGAISGHDYILYRKGSKDPCNLHVKYVVDAYTLACNINNWYILGRKDGLKGEKRDKWRSWLWIKE